MRCDQCATNYYRLSNTCPSCSNCFNEVFEIFSSLRNRLDWYGSFSESECNLLSSPLRLLLEGYTRDMAILLTDINTAERTDSRLYSSLTDLASRTMQLNDDVMELEAFARELQPRFIDLQEQSGNNLERARDTLNTIGDIYQTYSATTTALNQASQFILTGISGAIQDIFNIISKEVELVQWQGNLSSQITVLSTEVLSTSQETLTTALRLEELNSNLITLITTLFQLQTSIQIQVNMVNLTYPKVEEAADRAESLYQEILTLVNYPPINISVFSDEMLRGALLLLEENVRQLKNDSFTQSEESGEEIDRSSVLFETGKFLRNVTTVLLDRLYGSRTRAQSAVTTANDYINILKAKSNEINMTHGESTLLVELMDRFFYLLNETEQNITIENARATLAMIEASIDDVTRLETLIKANLMKGRKSKLDAQAADLTVNGISDKINARKIEIKEIERKITEVENKSLELEKHELEGRNELQETESTLDNVVLYTEYIKKRVELLELEYLKLNRSLEGIDIVSEEEVESIIMRISELEASVESNQQGLEATERELREEKAELEDLERAVYESYSQVREFDTLVDDIKEYNVDNSCD